MYVRNCWYVAGWDYELKPGELISRTIINEPVVLYRTEDGAVVGLADRCCHRFAPLSMGRIEGADVRCMYHGLKFDRTGVCIEIPGQDMIPATARVKSYPVAEKDNWIWVWMGDPAKADEALIPQAVGLDHPDWTLRSGQMDYAANYLLINDNLTDFTHLSYVHANSFGATEAFARTRPNVERLERGVRVWRWLSDSLRPDAQTRIHRRADGDNWQTYDYLAPGILLMHTAVCPTGTAEKCGYQPPDFSKVEVLADNFTSQAVTPVTDKTSRYLFSWGPRKAEGSDALAESMLTLANMAFSEDKAIIEAQQKIVDQDPGAKPILTSADVGPMLMRSVIERLIAAETKPAAASAA
jgi:vanillate O-demethylase monooxygenase subunit